jgi:hypothetical protein
LENSLPEAAPAPASCEGEPAPERDAPAILLPGGFITPDMPKGDRTAGESRGERLAVVGELERDPMGAGR